MDHVGDGTLPDHSVVQPQICEDLTSLPENRHIQHHPLFNGKIPVLQFPQGLQFSSLQFRHKAQSTHIDAKYRNLIQRDQFCQVQNRTVPTESDEEICFSQLLEQRANWGTE